MNAAKVIFAFFILICGSNSDDKEEFVPTNEWQVIKEGQKIPRGLHVRINLSTGLKEAKKLEAEQQQTRALVPIEEEKPQIDEKAQLKEALKKLKNDDVINPNKLKQTKDEFRTYEELKDSLGGLTPKLDSEIIHELVEEYKGVQSEAQKLQIIKAMEYLAHQHDNALEFVKMGCFKQILYPNLNATDAEMRRETLKLITSLIQNNSKPKIHTLETGGLPILLRLIALDPDKGVRNVAVTTLSALLRTFPTAQKHFINNGGFSLISQVLDGYEVKIQTKIATLITDLIIEHDFAKKDPQLLQYYSSFDLKKKVFESRWCENLDKLLTKLVAIDREDHDSLEKGLTALYTVHKDCTKKYDPSVVKQLRKYYKTLAAKDEENSDFFMGLKELCDNILQSTTRTEL